MSDLYSRIEQLCANQRISVTQLCVQCGVSRASLTDLKKGRKKTLSAKTLSRIANYFCVSIEYLMGETDAPSSTGGVWIPVLGKVAAGVPIDAVTDILDYEEISTAEAEKGEHFALRIKGDSMEPKMSDGDVVIVRRQSDCDDGDIAVVLINGGEATVKRIKKRPEGITLVPSNNAYESVSYSNYEIERLPISILGKVVELRAKELSKSFDAADRDILHAFNNLTELNKDKLLDYMRLLKASQDGQ